MSLDPTLSHHLFHISSTYTWYGCVALLTNNAYTVSHEVHNHNLRNVLKRFSDWPTIPQVYVKGTFLGGYDIIEEMHKSGELKSIMMK